MAHFLSNATHIRLEGRQHRSASVVPPTVSQDGAFNAIIRSLCCLPSVKVNDTISFTGDIDGNLNVRRGVEGAVEQSIDFKKNVFVFAIALKSPYVWAGWTDGYMSVYEDRAPYSKVADVRAHVGAINAIVTASQFVVTAGSDWQIFVWDAATLQKLPRGQLSGHQNAVRALALDGDVLFSAGDDLTIRSWDLVALAERGGPWPVQDHQASIRGLVVSDVYLFSASADGTTKVRNTQTGALVRVLEQRATAVTAIEFDVANQFVWTGGGDGLLRIWDASSLALVTELTAHETTNVAAVKSIARFNAIKAWSVDANGAISTSLCVSDPTRFPVVEKALQQQNDLQPIVEDRRTQLMTHYDLLLQCKQRLEEINAAAQAMKERMAVAFGAFHNRRSQLAVVNRARNFVDRVTQRRSQAEAAVTFASRGTVRHLAGHYLKWLTYTAARQQACFVRNMSAHFTVLDKQRVARAYATYVAMAKRGSQRMLLRSKMAVATHVRSTASHVRSRYGTWFRFSELRRDQKRAEAAAKLVTVFVNRNDATVAWEHIRRTVAATRKVELREALLQRLASAFPLSSMRDGFTRWVALVNRNAVRRRAISACLFLAASSDATRMRMAYNKLALIARDRRGQQRSLKWHHTQERVTTLEKQLAQSSELTEEGLEELIRRKQDELALLEVQLAEADRNLQEAQDTKRQLQRDMLKDPSIDESAPKLSTLLQMMYLLKARGVNVKLHRDIIGQAREDAKTMGAPAVLMDGLAMVRKVCSRVIRPARLTEPGSADWFVGPLFDKIKKKSIVAASVGIVRCVTAFDVINMRDSEAWIVRDSEGNEAWSAQHSYNAELLANYGTLLELSVRAYRIRRGEDPVTGERLTKAKKSSPRKLRTPREGVALTPRGAKKRPAAAAAAAVSEAPKKFETEPQKKKAKKATKKKTDGKKRKGGKKKKKASKTAEADAPVVADGTATAESASPASAEPAAAAPVTADTTAPVATSGEAAVPAPAPASPPTADNPPPPQAVPPIVTPADEGSSSATTAYEPARLAEAEEEF